MFTTLLKSGTILAAVAGATFLLPLDSQRRVKPKGPADAAEELKAALTSLGHKQYSAVLKHIDKAKGAVLAAWSRLVREAMPMAPEGWTFKDPDTAGAANNPFAAAMGLGNLVQSQVKRTYKGPGGKRFDLEVQLNSPAVRTIAMLFKNPMMRGKNYEPIEYDGYEGLLDKKGSLQIIFDDAHLVIGRGTRMSGDDVLRWMSQQNCDRIHVALKGGGKKN